MFNDYNNNTCKLIIYAKSIGAPENKICLFSWETVNYCNDIILSKQRNFKIEILNDIHKLIINNPFIIRNDIIDTIFKKYNIILSQNSIYSIFKKLNLIRKKPKHYIVKSVDFLNLVIKNFFRNKKNLFGVIVIK